jgi:hypothetical protein
MRVLAGPRVDLEAGSLALAVARSLAGAEGTVRSLREVGVRNLARRLSASEVALLRKAMMGVAGNVVGYVCGGAGAARADDKREAAGRARRGRAGAEVPSTVIAVTDHANLTWRSPLTGANDDRVGPRFPSMTGIYDPGLVTERLKAAEGMIVVMPGIIAGVRDDEQLNAFEKAVAESLNVSAASSELVSVAIVAAHMGLRVAAVVVIAGPTAKGEG